MRRLLSLSLVMLSASGCSGDPASSRLKLGDEAIVRVPEADPKRPPVPKVKMSDGTEVDEYPTHDGSVEMREKEKPTHYIHAASKVRVISDDQPADICEMQPPSLADLDGKVDRRWVKVRVLDGLNANDEGELPRNTLRPLP